MEKLEARKQFNIIRESIKHKIWGRDKYICQYCGKKVITYDDIFDIATQKNWSYDTYYKVLNSTVKDRATIDHIIPLSKGGSNELKNLITACHSCNSKKGNRIWKK